jgi:hypothetical protein
MIRAVELIEGHAQSDHVHLFTFLLDRLSVRNIFSWSEAFKLWNLRRLD